MNGIIPQEIADAFEGLAWTGDGRVVMRSDPAITGYPLDLDDFYLRLGELLCRSLPL
jgi:hypothetical protein